MIPSPVITVDAQYVHPKKMAIYIVPLISGKIAIVDANTSNATPLIQRAFQNAKLDLHQVCFIILTHIHLDHAAGIHSLLKICPNARVLVHPRGVRHLIDPSRLIAATKSIYGDVQFQKLFGTVLGIAPERIKTVSEKENDWIEKDCGEKFSFLFTEGHARHHICIYLPDRKLLFAGDNFGISYPELRNKHNSRAVIFPSTPPADFDARKARESIQTILDLIPDGIFIAHYGKIYDIHRAARILFSGLDHYEKIVSETVKKIAADTEDSTISTEIKENIHNHLQQIAIQEKVAWSHKEEKMVQADIALNISGILAAAKKIVKPDASAKKNMIQQEKKRPEGALEK